MSLDYTGDPTATQAPGPTPGQAVEPIMRVPTDGDALSAASIRQAHKEAADFIAYLTNFAAIVNGPNSFSDVNAFTEAILAQNGAEVTGQPLIANGAGTNDLSTAFEILATPTAHFEAFKFKIGGATVVYLRMFLEPTDDAASFTINAKWTGTAWDRDDSGKSAAYRLKLRRGGTYGLALQYYTTAGTWAEGAWVDVFRTLNANSIFESLADVKALHHTCSGGTPSRVVDAHAGVGATSTLTGCDQAGTLSLTTGTGVGTGALIAITFASAFPSAPRVALTAKDPAAAAAAAKVYVTSVSTTGFSIAADPVLPDSLLHTWDWVALSPS